MVKLTETSSAVFAEELKKIEESLGVSFPETLKSLWLVTNGGILADKRRVYQSTHYENDIKYFLPVLHTKDAGLLTVDDYYQTLVFDKKILPANFIPFAIDGGGFPYCVGADDGAVYFCDLENGEENFLEPDLETFVGKIIPEDEAW